MNSRGLTRQTKPSPRKYSEVGKRAKQARNVTLARIHELETDVQTYGRVADRTMAFGLIMLAASFAAYFFAMLGLGVATLAFSVLAMVPYRVLRSREDAARRELADLT